MPITPIEIDYALLREYDDGNVSVTDLTVCRIVCGNY